LDPFFAAIASRSIRVASYKREATVAVIKKKSRTVDEWALVADVDGTSAMLNACRDKVYELIRER
jgi:hypothetical protein